MKHVSRLLSLLAALALALAAPAAFGEKFRSHFDSDGVSGPPAFFDLQVLGAPGFARWMVLADHNNPSPPNQVTQTIATRPSGSLAVALRRDVVFQDGMVSVALKKLPAHAGLVFRTAGEKDFLALLMDCQSGEARLTAYRGGKPTELATGKADIDLAWGMLKVSLAGPEITASWNEKTLLQGKDAKPAAGRAGLATEGPGFASFDEFLIDTGDAKP